MIQPAIECDFTPVTLANSVRVRDFRGEERVSEYREKLTRNEVGFFSVSDGKVIGSIWATINNAQVPTVVRAYMKLMPKEALIHDIVTGDKFLGMGVGSFMVGRVASILLNEFGVSRIVIDVNVRNSRSLGMMSRVGLQVKEKVFYVSGFSRLVLQLTFRKYDYS